MLDFLIVQIRLAGKPKNLFRYTVEEKSLFLSLYSASPKCYRLLRKIVNAPSIRTLQKMLQNLNFSPGFHHSTLHSLSSKSKTLDPKDKLCVLLMDEISLKEHLHYDDKHDKIIGLENFGISSGNSIANHATVFMIRGLTHKWKQPFAFFFSNGTMRSNKLKTLMLDGIRMINNTGLKCVGVVCDQGANNLSVMKSLGVTIDNPFFFINNETKINLFYDPPHALKNIRNNLKTKDFILDGTPISWQIIEELYAFDSENNCRLLPKLTEKHLSLDGFGTKMRVRLAAQVLSHTVASAIKTLSELKFWDEEKQKIALKTAEFVENFNNLFDIFNTKTFTEAKPFSKPISENGNSWEFLKKCMTWLPKLKQIGKPHGQQLPCVQAWQLNINSLQDMWQRLSTDEEIKLKFLFTNRLNQDALENFFSLIRSKNTNDDRPDPSRFQSAFRSLSFESLFSLSKSSNCENDSDFFLLKPDDYYQNVCKMNEMIMHDHSYMKVDNDENDENTSNTAEINSIEKNAISYISGYLLHKLLKINKCEPCQSKLKSTLEAKTNNDKYIFLKHKQYDNLGVNKGLCIPSDSFVSFVTKLVTIIDSRMNLFTGSFVTKKITQLCLNEVQNFDITCGNDVCLHSIMNITKLLIKIKVHFKTKETNQSLGNKSKKNKKLVKLMHQ